MTWAKNRANRWVSAQYLAVHGPGPAATRDRGTRAHRQRRPVAPGGVGHPKLGPGGRRSASPLTAVPDPSLTVAALIESGVDRVVSKPPVSRNPGRLSRSRALSPNGPSGPRRFAPGAAAHHWIAGLSLADWAMPVFTLSASLAPSISGVAIPPHGISRTGPKAWPTACSTNSSKASNLPQNLGRGVHAGGAATN